MERGECAVVRRRSFCVREACCLVCLRQFTSERHVERHVVRSALHATNLANAVAAGRVPPSLSDIARPAKRERSAVEVNSAGGGGGGGNGSGGGIGGDGGRGNGDARDVEAQSVNPVRWYEETQ